MDRYILTDAQWAKMEPVCLGKVTDRGRSGKKIIDYFLEAVPWIVCTGSPWRDLLLILVNGIPSLKDTGDWVKSWCI